MYDGRLYRCDVRFSGQLITADNDVAVSDEAGERHDSDEDSAGWEEREASRQHSVKFTDDVEENKEVGRALEIVYDCEYCGLSHYDSCDHINSRCRLCCCSCDHDYCWVCVCGRRLWAWLGACFGGMGGGRLRKAESYYMMYSELEAKNAL